MSAETDTLLPQDDALDPQPGRAPERQESEARLPLSRETPPETREHPVPPALAPEGRSGVPGDDTPRRNRSRRALHASLAGLLVALFAGGGYLYWDNANRYE